MTKARTAEQVTSEIESLIAKMNYHTEQYQEGKKQLAKLERELHATKIRGSLGRSVRLIYPRWFINLEHYGKSPAKLLEVRRTQCVVQWADGKQWTVAIEDVEPVEAPAEAVPAVGA